MIRTLLDFISVTLFICAIYIGWCVYDRLQPPVEYRITKIAVEKDHSGKLKNEYIITSHDELKTLRIDASPRDVLHVTFIVNQLRSADVNFERIFMDSDGKRFSLFTVTKTLDGERLGYTTLDSEYVVPTFAARGCGFIFSRVSFELHYNLLTLLKPIVILGPKISVCLDQGKISEYPF